VINWERQQGDMQFKSIHNKMMMDQFYHSSRLVSNVEANISSAKMQGNPERTNVFWGKS
jgi:hypothetical protein